MNVSNLFRSLRTNERLWVKCSGRSWQISKFERFAQVTQDKWANEEIARVFWANCSFFSFVYTKLAIRSKKFEKLYYLYNFTVFWSKKKKKITHSFWAVSKLHRSLRTNVQPWAIRSRHSEGMSDCEGIAQVAHQKWANEHIAHFLSKWLICSLFRQTTSNSHQGQDSMSDFPTLPLSKPATLLMQTILTSKI